MLGSRLHFKAAAILTCSPLRALCQSARCHSHGGHPDGASDDATVTPISQTPTHSGIAAIDLEAIPSVAMSVAPPKTGRYQVRKMSGLQREILTLYKSLLKESKKFEDKGTVDSITAHIRSQFRKNQQIPRKMLSKIEWEMHYGRNKLEELHVMKKSSKFSIRTPQQ